MTTRIFLPTVCLVVAAFTGAPLAATQSKAAKTGEKVGDAARVSKDKTVQGVTKGAEATKEATTEAATTVGRETKKGLGAVGGEFMKIGKATECAVEGAKKGAKGAKR